MLIGVIAFGIGAISTLAPKTHAQTTDTNIPLIATVSYQEDMKGDANNIQNITKDIEKSDVVVSQGSNKETNNDQISKSETDQGDTQIQNESTTTDSNEVENSD